MLQEQKKIKKTFADIKICDGENVEEGRRKEQLKHFHELLNNGELYDTSMRYEHGYDPKYHMDMDPLVDEEYATDIKEVQNLLRAEQLYVSNRSISVAARIGELCKNLKALVKDDKKKYKKGFRGFVKQHFKCSVARLNEKINIYEAKSVYGHLDPEETLPGINMVIFQKLGAALNGNNPSLSSWSRSFLKNKKVKSLDGELLSFSETPAKDLYAAILNKVKSKSKISKAKSFSEIKKVVLQFKETIKNIDSVVKSIKKKTYKVSSEDRKHLKDIVSTSDKLIEQTKELVKFLKGAKHEKV